MATDPLTDDDLDRMSQIGAAAKIICPHISIGRDLCRLVDEVRQLRAERSAVEGWPRLAAESRAALFRLCVDAGVNCEGKWLIEAAAEAIRQLTAANLAAASECLTRAALRELLDFLDGSAAQVAYAAAKARRVLGETP